MAALHTQAATVHLPTTLTPMTWHTVFYYHHEPVVIEKPAYATLFTPARRAVIADVAAAAEAVLQALVQSPQQRILIHGDLHPWNVHLVRQRFVVLDFEDVLLGYPVQDIAITFAALRRYADAAQLQRAFEAGYYRVRAWPVETATQLTALKAARDLMMLNYVAQAEADPEPVVERICRRLETARSVSAPNHERLTLRYVAAKRRSPCRHRPTTLEFLYALFLKPVGDHAAAGMNVEVPDAASAGVDIRVRRMRRNNHQLPGGRRDRLVANGEADVALQHHEDLGIRVRMEAGSAAWLCLDQKEGHVGRSIVVAFEAVGGGAMGQRVLVDEESHVRFPPSEAVRSASVTCTGQANIHQQATYREHVLVRRDTAQLCMLF